MKRLTRIDWLKLIYFLHVKLKTELKLTSRPSFAFGFVLGAL